MKLEHRKQQLLPQALFIRRVIYYFGFSLLILSFSLGLGTAGYHYFGNLHLVDSILNASMILTGMGPVDRMETNGGKLFASFYALYSGIAFLSTVALLFTPIVHRFLHKIHLDFEDKDE